MKRMPDQELLLEMAQWVHNLTPENVTPLGPGLGLGEKKPIRLSSERQEARGEPEWGIAIPPPPSEEQKSLRFARPAVAKDTGENEILRLAPPDSRSSVKDSGKSTAVGQNHRLQALASTDAKKRPMAFFKTMLALKRPVKPMTTSRPYLPIPITSPSPSIAAILPESAPNKPLPPRPHGESRQRQRIAPSPSQSPKTKRSPPRIRKHSNKLRLRTWFLIVPGHLIDLTIVITTLILVSAGVGLLLDPTPLYQESAWLNWLPIRVLSHTSALILIAVTYFSYSIYLGFFLILVGKTLGDIIVNNISPPSPTSQSRSAESLT